VVDSVKEEINKLEHAQSETALRIVFGEDLGLGQSAANLVEEESKQGVGLLYSRQRVVVKLVLVKMLMYSSVAQTNAPLPKQLNKILVVIVCWSAQLVMRA